MPYKMVGAAADAVLNTARLGFDIGSYIETRDYNRALQQKIFEREDTAYQRAVQDAKKAGLSPLAITGGSGSGAVVSEASRPNSSDSDILSLILAVEEAKRANRADKRDEERHKSDMLTDKAQRNKLLAETDKVRSDMNLSKDELAFRKDVQSFSEQMAEAQLTHQGNQLQFEKDKLARQFAHDIAAQLRQYGFQKSLSEFNFKNEKDLESLRQVFRAATNEQLHELQISLEEYKKGRVRKDGNYAAQFIDGLIYYWKEVIPFVGSFK